MNIDNQRLTTGYRLINFETIFCMGFKFEKLQIWQLAVDLSYEIHELTRSFPKEELFILTSQIKRAADSVSLNIAEGSTGQSNPEIEKIYWIFPKICFRSCRLSLPWKEKRAVNN